MADKKALFRAKLAQRNQKRIENPLVRYNDHDQPVCRVCDVVLKSETDWTVHQTSRKHKVAIDTLKANSATLKQTINANVERPKDSHRAKFENHEELHSKGAEPSMGLSKPRQTSSLPPNFFDSKETKKQKSAPTTESRDFDKFKHTEANVQSKELQSSIPSGKVDIKIENTDSKSSEFGPSKEQISTLPLGSETRKAKGLIPEGFYDNKDADLRARGITPIKLDVKDEYKEFEKLIQEDLQQVDKRLEEEEYDAADMIEEAETVEQRAYKERVEMLKKRKMELKAGKSTLRSKATPPATAKESTVEEELSSDTDSDDEILTVDWRAKHL